MSNAKTGIWSAIGALVGGAAGAMAGQYAISARPRVRYAAARGRGDEIEDAMVVGGAGGAVLGAFLAGALAGEEPPPQLPSR
jgi:hypothetical protein